MWNGIRQEAHVEAVQLYEAGAHFVMQTDALAMRKCKDIFIETVANVGDCSQLVISGQAHKRRLKKLEQEDQRQDLPNKNQPTYASAARQTVCIGFASQQHRPCTPPCDGRI